MRKFFVFVSLLLVTTAILFGCGKTENTTSTAATTVIQNVDKTGTLQGKIMDATTGAPISMNANGDRIVLIQGTSDRGPDKLNTDPNDALVGEYAFSGIPVESASANTHFKVVVIKAGYQRFEGDVTITAPLSPGGYIDNVINMIGNIYLFPLGAVPSDLTVTVRSNHLIPVPNATVLLQQNVANNNDTAITGDRLAPLGGLYTSMTATTDANGVATFSGANLVLGGNYIATAVAQNFQGDELRTTSTTLSFIIGTNTEAQVINMTSPLAFFATSTSNQVPGTITPSGVLTIAFNEPIALTTTFFSATLLASNGTLTTPQAIGSVSPDGLTLTLTPNFATAPTATALGANITYSELVPGASQMIQTNTQTLAPPLTVITNRSTSALINRTVQLVGN